MACICRHGAAAACLASAQAAVALAVGQQQQQLLSGLQQRQLSRGTKAVQLIPHSYSISTRVYQVGTNWKCSLAPMAFSPFFHVYSMLLHSYAYSHVDQDWKVGDSLNCKTNGTVIFRFSEHLHDFRSLHTFFVYPAHIIQHFDMFVFKCSVPPFHQCLHAYVHMLLRFHTFIIGISGGNLGQSQLELYKQWHAFIQVFSPYAHILQPFNHNYLSQSLFYSIYLLCSTQFQSISTFLTLIHTVDGR